MTTWPTWRVRMGEVGGVFSYWTDLDVIVKTSGGGGGIVKFVCEEDIR